MMMKFPEHLKYLLSRVFGEAQHTRGASMGTVKYAKRQRALREWVPVVLCALCVYFVVLGALLHFGTVRSVALACVIALCAGGSLVCAFVFGGEAPASRDVRVRTLFRRTSETYSRLKASIKQQKRQAGGGGGGGGRGGGGVGGGRGSGAGGSVAAGAGTSLTVTLPGSVIDAVRRGDVDTVDRWVKANNVDARDAMSGSTLLHYAALEDQSRVARCLLKASANPNIADADGNQPLHVAAARGSAILVKYLCEHGASPHALNQPSKDGGERKSPMDMAEDFDNRGCMLIMERCVRVRANADHARQGVGGTARMRSTPSRVEGV